MAPKFVADGKSDYHTNLIYKLSDMGDGNTSGWGLRQIDKSLYLIKRGYFINFLGLCGFVILTTIIVGQKKQGRKD
jgi:hypothetical protein